MTREEVISEFEDLGNDWAMVDHDDDRKAAREGICSRPKKRHQAIQAFLKD